MYTSSDFRRGLPILVDDQPYYVVSYQHFKMGRGKANVRTKLKHIETGAVLEKVFSPTESFKRPDIVTKKMQYLYEDSGEYMFMDSQTYEQIQVNADGIGDAKWYLKEQEEYQILFLNGRAISLELPAAVILKVIQTEPSARGDTVSNITKPATLDGGLEVKVPPFIKEGDMVKVDTRTGEYLERAN